MSTINLISVLPLTCCLAWAQQQPVSDAALIQELSAMKRRIE